jgi:hypothetical protein
MWIDIIHGYINKDAIDFIEDLKDGQNTVLLHMRGGEKIELKGKIAVNVLDYVRLNKVQFVDQLYNPVGLNGVTL